MRSGRPHPAPRYLLRYLLSFALALIAFTVAWSFGRVQAQQTAATYAHGRLSVTIPYHATSRGSGKLVAELLDPEGHVLGHSESEADVAIGGGSWQQVIVPDQPIAFEDVIWQRLRYRFDYYDTDLAPIKGIESISQILRRPVVHIIGQTEYLSGSEAAIRVIVSDADHQDVAESGSVHIELLSSGGNTHPLFSGSLNRRGTVEAQFRFPAGLTGNFQLHYVADTPIGSAEFTQAVQLKDKASILLTTEKPIYQPGQTIHVRALALDRADSRAEAGRKLTFEMEDSRGNKVFKKSTETDSFGIASAEFSLADEVNLGTYHLRALMGDLPRPPTPPSSPSMSSAMSFPSSRSPLSSPPPTASLNSTTVPATTSPAPCAQTTSSASRSITPISPSRHPAPTSLSSTPQPPAARPTPMASITSTSNCPRTSPGVRSARARPARWSRPRSPTPPTTPRPAASPSPSANPPCCSPPCPREAPSSRTSRTRSTCLRPTPMAPPPLQPSPSPSSTPATSTSPPTAAASPSSASTPAPASTPCASKPTTTTAIASPQPRRCKPARGDDQILLRTNRARLKAGDRLQLTVLSTRAHGTAYVDVVKSGQTILTRDLDLKNGHADLDLLVTPQMAGTLDLDAYLFGQNAQPVADHRLVFVQPADELKIETTTDAVLYKPGSDARIRFHVSNANGQGVSAALGLQIVDEAVFALAEKQPGFAKVFFYLEQEAMKPRYEIHSLTMSNVIQPDVTEPTAPAARPAGPRSPRALLRHRDGQPRQARHRVRPQSAPG